MRGYQGIIQERQNKLVYLNKEKRKVKSNFFVDFYYQIKAHKIIVTSFPYPDDHAHLMSRIVLSAGHKQEDIKHLLHCLNTPEI